MEVGADDGAADDALLAVLAVVAVPVEHAAERLLAGPEVGAAAVVLEAGEDAEARVDGDVADQPWLVRAHRLQVDEAEARQRGGAHLVGMAEELEAAADGEDDLVGGGRGVHARRA